MNDDWVKGATTAEIQALETFTHLLPSEQSETRRRLILLIAYWKTSIENLRDALLHEDEILPMLRKKYSELDAQLQHKRMVYEQTKDLNSRVVDTIRDAIRKLEKQTTDEVKRNDWSFWKHEAQSRTAEARRRRDQLTTLLTIYERTGKLPEEKKHAHRESRRDLA